MSSSFAHVVYLSGGVGGARLLDGLARALPPAGLTAIVNVGDDFEPFGLYVCPDIDTVLYTLSGVGDQKRGWGLRAESFRALHAVQNLGGPDWFQLGDRDLGTHLVRTQWLRDGQTLTAVTHRLARALGVGPTVLPMCDEPLRSEIETASEGTLGFQDWLVRRRGQPRVARVHFRGEARPTAEVMNTLERAELVVIGPSNPYVSIDPILALPGLRAALERKRVVAVSPIVAGQAVKGPLAEMIPTLAGRAPSAGAIAAHYGGLLAGMVVEQGDEASVEGLPVLGTRSVMLTRRDRARLAREVLSFAETLCR
ncbi:MAG: 2-phospho-L-lactate transferase [Polyangiales bacterium]